MPPQDNEILGSGKPMNQSVAQLRYYLIDGLPPLQPMRILETKTIAWRDWRVTLCILGASHAVSLERGVYALTELLACAQPSGGLPIVAEAVADNCAEVEIAAHGLLCSIELRPFFLQEGDDLLDVYSPDQTMTVAYPAYGAGMTPITRVGWRADAGRLRIETIHSYPEEERGVRSVSIFAAQEERNAVSE